MLQEIVYEMYQKLLHILLRVKESAKFKIKVNKNHLKHNMLQIFGTSILYKKKILNKCYNFIFITMKISNHIILFYLLIFFLFCTEFGKSIPGGKKSHPVLPPPISRGVPLRIIQLGPNNHVGRRRRSRSRSRSRSRERHSNVGTYQKRLYESNMRGGHKY
uniref:Uncharacterized protein n=1 Tax=Strongyloides venezuelensis TaxID=75913 RepID=A0A0K0EUT3_STRVS